MTMPCGFRLLPHPDRDLGTAAGRKAWSTLTRIVDSLAEVDRSGCGWRNWGEAVGIRWDDGNPTVAFSHAHLVLKAAAEGVGIALARRVLAADDLASGRLQRLGPAVPAVSPITSSPLVASPRRAAVRWHRGSRRNSRRRAGATANPRRRSPGFDEMSASGLIAT